MVDGKFLEKIKNGDLKAYNKLFKIYYKRLCIYANQVLFDFEQSRDVVQEVFLKLWENRSQIIENKNLEKYLFQSVKNTSIDKLRKHKTENKYYDYLINLYSDPTIEYNYLELEELETLISKTINSLPLLTQKVFSLSRDEKKKYSEISKQLGISKKSVEYHMSKSIKELKDSIENFYKKS
jgi:RNA polymerase sigma-70 factor (ECF subfamily)